MSDASDTSVHARRAIRGDDESLAWIVDRFSPLLMAQAHHRLGPALRRRVTPEDIVQEAWAIALPRLDSLAFEGRVAPVIMKFLSTIVLHRVNRQIRAQIRDTEHGPGLHEWHRRDDQHYGVLTSVIRREVVRSVVAAMDCLHARDREVLVLRLIEQRSGTETAEFLGISRDTVYVRQHRAVAEIRKHVANSLFDDLDLEET